MSSLSDSCPHMWKVLNPAAEVSDLILIWMSPQRLALTYNKRQNLSGVRSKSVDTQEDLERRRKLKSDVNGDGEHMPLHYRYESVALSGFTLE